MRWRCVSFVPHSGREFDMFLTISGAALVIISIAFFCFLRLAKAELIRSSKIQALAL